MFFVISFPQNPSWINFIFIMVMFDFSTKIRVIKHKFWILEFIITNKILLRCVVYNAVSRLTRTLRLNHLQSWWYLLHTHKPSSRKVRVLNQGDRSVLRVLSCYAQFNYWVYVHVYVIKYWRTIPTNTDKKIKLRPKHNVVHY